MEIKFVYLIVIAIMSIITFALFALDNAIAVGSVSIFTRVPEYILLILMALGGGIGGAVGMIVCSHKTTRLSFIFTAILTCVFNIGTAIALFIIGG